MRTPDDVASAISGREPGDEVDVVVARDGDRRTVPIELGSAPRARRDGAVSFASPGLLLGLLLIPLAVVLYVRSERARARSRQAFARPALMPAVAPARAGWRRHAPPALYALALAGLVIALARPQATVAVPDEQATVVLTTDYSGSMEATGRQPSRLAAAEQAAERFLDRVPDEVRVGAVAFNHRARLVQSPTTDRDALRAGRCRPSPQRGHGHRRCAGARPAGGAAPRASGRQASAGRDHPALRRHVRARRGPAAGRARGRARQGARLHRRAGHRRRHHPRPRAQRERRVERVPPDRDSMRQIARITGGRYFEAADTEQLDAVYERLGSQVTTRDERREVTAAAAAGALLLVLSAAGMSLRWFGRVP